MPLCTTGPCYAAFALSLLVATGILIWGLQKLNAAISSPDPSRGGAPLIAGVLREKRKRTVTTTVTRPTLAGATLVAGAAPTTETETRQEEDPQAGGSYSRVSGAIGSMVLVAIVAGLGYFILYSVFFNHCLLFVEVTEDGNKKTVDLIYSLRYYFLGASALFAPYAFNQLSSIFSKA